MKAFVLILTLGLAACQSSKIPILHTKPDSAPVARPIVKTRLAIAETRSAIRSAVVAAGSGEQTSLAASKRASDIAQTAANAVEHGLRAKSDEARRLAEETARLATEVAELKARFRETTVQLREAESAAAFAEARNFEAEEKLAAFDVAVAAQTATLNEREADVVRERAAKEDAIAARNAAEGKLRALRWKIAGWVSAAVLLAGAGIYFRLIRFGL